MSIKRLVKNVANAFGIDLVRLHQSPRQTLLGLRERHIGSIVDVGANRGQFARGMSRFFPDARMYCFEPLEVPFRQLEQWADSERGRIQCFNIALGDSEGEVQMHRHDGHTPSSSLLEATAHCHTMYPQTREESITSVKLTTLDRALASEIDQMPRDILLKLDVQGFEDRVLRGGATILRESSACILEVCLDPLYQDQADFFELAARMKDAGFKYSGNLDQHYAEDGRVVFLDALFTKR